MLDVPFYWIWPSTNISNSWTVDFINEDKWANITLKSFVIFESFNWMILLFKIGSAKVDMNTFVIYWIKNHSSLFTSLQGQFLLVQSPKTLVLPSARQNRMFQQHNVLCHKSIANRKSETNKKKIPSDAVITLWNLKSKYLMMIFEIV